MSSPIILITPYSSLTSHNAALQAICKQVAFRHEKSFNNFWTGSIDSTVENAEALNQLAVDTSTVDQPQTALSMFEDHSAFAALVKQVTPSESISSPPINMALVFNEDGSINITAFSEAVTEIYKEIV
jgi:hypothetical protein